MNASINRLFALASLQSVRWRKLRTGLIWCFAAGTLGCAQSASGAPLSTEASKAGGLWRFHLVEEDGGAMCQASVTLGAISTGFTAFGSDSVAAFVESPGLPSELTMSWVVDGSPLSALTGKIDDYFGWHEFGNVQAAMLDGLAAGSQLELSGGGATFRFSLLGAATALDQFQKCMSSAPRQANGTVAGANGFEEEELIQQQTQVPSEEPSGDKQTALGRALQNSQQPMLATYVCDVTAAALSGLPDISGDNKATRTTLSIDTSGQLHVNGTTITPQYAEPQPNEGSITLVAYSAQSVAASSSGVPATMPGISAEQMQELQAGINFMLGQAFQGRDRYMVISLNNDTVQFFDLSPDGQMVNTSASNCARVQ